MPALVVRIGLLLIVAVMSIFGPLTSAFAAHAEPRETSLVAHPRAPDGRVIGSVRVLPADPLTVTLPRMIAPAGDVIRPTSVYTTGTGADGLTTAGTAVLTAIRNVFAIAAAIGITGYFITTVLQGFFGDAMGTSKTGFMKLMVACIGAGLVTQIVNWAISIGGGTGINGLSSAPMVVHLLWWRYQQWGRVTPLPVDMPDPS